MASARALAVASVPRWDGPGPAPDLACAYLGSVGMFATSVGRPFPSGDPGWEPWYAGLRTLSWPDHAAGDCAEGSYGTGPRRMSETALAYLIESDALQDLRVSVVLPTVASSLRRHLRRLGERSARG